MEISSGELFPLYFYYIRFLYTGQLYFEVDWAMEMYALAQRNGEEELMQRILDSLKQTVADDDLFRLYCY